MRKHLRNSMLGMIVGKENNVFENELYFYCESDMI